MSSSNCCFLTCIQVSQEADQVVWYPHLLKNFPQFIVIHTVKGFGIVNKAEMDVFLELSCFFDDPADVGNLISGSSAFLKPAWTSGSSWFTYCSKAILRDFLGGTVDKNLPASAGDSGSIPSLGRFHMPQSNLASHNCWAHAPRACAPQQEKPSQGEAHALQLESSPHSPQLEKACKQQQRPSTAKNK